MAVLLTSFQPQVTREVLAAHVFCPTLVSSVLSVTFTELPTHYAYKNVFLEHIINVWS